MKKLLISAILVLSATFAKAATVSELGQDVVDQSKVTFLKEAQLGWGWSLKEEDGGAPTAILGIYSYRFLSLNIGWHEPYNKEESYCPSPMIGVSLDKLTRQIAPSFSDTVKGYVPALLQPFWSQLVVSYGPLYQVNKGEWGHLLAVNINFGS